ncbi:MAG: DUF2393 family protein [Campylobacterales bacterium]|nr:DUF2393 family protein [Campylobacterales bacterium]
MYFTVLHWIAISFYIVIFMLLTFLATRGDNRKIFISLFFSSILVTVLLSFITLMVLDKYTKKGKLEKIDYTKVLRNETLVFSGTVRNVGSFKIGNCTLEIKIINQVSNLDTLSGAQLFTPKSRFFEMFQRDKEDFINHYTQEFRVVENLEPRRSKNFTVIMKYPIQFKNPSISYKLDCH